MSGRAIIPRIYCWQENGNRPPFVPLQHRYVICFEARRTSTKTAGPNPWRMHGPPILAYTESDGKLHELSATDCNITSYKDGWFYINKFKTWQVIKKANPRLPLEPYRILVTNRADPKTDRAFVCFAVPVILMKRYMVNPYEKYRIQMAWLIKHKLLAWVQLKPNVLASSKHGFWVGVNMLWPDYYLRMKDLSAALNWKIKRISKKMSDLLAAAHILEEMNKVVWKNSIGHKNKGNAKYVAAECKLLRNELFNPLRRYLHKKMANLRKHGGRNINHLAERIVRHLDNPQHHLAFKNYFKTPFIKEYLIREHRQTTIKRRYRLDYMFAYCLVSRTKKRKRLYNLHVGNFLRKINLKTTNRKQAIKKAVDDFSKKAGWFKSFGSEFIAIAQAYAAPTLNSRGHARDLHRAMAFLAGRNLVKNWNEFDQEMKTLDEIFRTKKRPQREVAKALGEKFIKSKFPKTDIGVKALTNSLHALKVASILTTDYSKEKATTIIGDTTAMIGLGVEITKIRRVEKILGGLPSPVDKTLGRFTGGVDWAVGLYTLSSEDWKKDGYGFAMAVVSCTGKSLAFAGTMVGPPVGLVLVAFGGALEIVASAIDYATSQTSEDLTKFNNLKGRLFKVCPDIRSEYKILAVYKKRRMGSGKFAPEVPNVVSTMKTCVRLRASSSAGTDTSQKTRAIASRLHRAVSTTWGDHRDASKGMRLEDVIKKHLTSNDWGVRVAISGVKEWNEIRTLLAA